MKKIVQFSSLFLVALSVMTVSVLSPFYVHSPEVPKELLKK
ncbi:MAG: cyclic lactone autoinducer peptide [Paenibacillaceae bacterium]